MNKEKVLDLLGTIKKEVEAEDEEEVEPWRWKEDDEPSSLVFPYYQTGAVECKNIISSVGDYVGKVNCEYANLVAAAPEMRDLLREVRVFIDPDWYDGVFKFDIERILEKIDG